MRATMGNKEWSVSLLHRDENKAHQAGKMDRAQCSYQMAVVSHDVILHPRRWLQLLPAVWAGEGLLRRTDHKAVSHKPLCHWNCLISNKPYALNLDLGHWVLTSLQFSMCFFSPSTVFLLTLLHLGQVTLPLATICRCQRSSWLPGGCQQRQKLYSTQ